MSKEALIAHLREETAREIEAIRADTARRIQALEDDFAAYRNELLEDARAQGWQQARREKELLMQGLQTQAEHDRQNLYWQVLGEVFADVKERLAGMRDDAGYRQLFEGLFRESVAQLQRHNAAVGRILVQIDPRDAAWMDAMTCEVEVEIQPDLETWGGMMVRDNERGVLIDNRLESRFERVHPVFIQDWLAEVAKLLQDGA